MSKTEAVYSIGKNVGYRTWNYGNNVWRTGKVEATRGKGNQTLLLVVEYVLPNGAKAFDEVLTSEPTLTLLPDDPAPRKKVNRLRKLINRTFRWR